MWLSISEMHFIVCTHYQIKPIGGLGLSHPHPTLTWEKALIFLFSSALMHLTPSWNINQLRPEWKSIQPWNIAPDIKNKCEKKTQHTASFSTFWRIVLALQSATVLFSLCKQLWIWILYDIFNARWCIPKTVLSKAECPLLAVIYDCCFVANKTPNTNK